MKIPAVLIKYKRIALALLVIVALFFAKMHYSQWHKRQLVKKEIESLTEQQQDLEQKNKDLADSLAYLTTGDYKERIAKQQLNLKKDGEIVYTFNEQKETPEAAPPAPPTASDHARAWWFYFFKP